MTRRADATIRLPPSTSDEVGTFDGLLLRNSVGAAHQNAVEVISGHVGGRSWQQGPRLAFVVRNESLDVLVHQFVGQIHAVDALHLGHKAVRLVALRNDFQGFFGG